MNKTGNTPQVLKTPAFDHTRRAFMKWSAALGGAAALVSGEMSLGLKAIGATGTGPEAKEAMAWTSCIVNCGACCPIRVFTKDGRITRVETDNTGDGEGKTEVRACLRGRSVRQLVYSPDRIKYPMKRVAGVVKENFSKSPGTRPLTLSPGN